MRKLIGCGVLLAGVGGLGYLATTQHAVRLQTDVTTAVQMVVQTTPHPIAATVSGRDVQVSGLVTDQTELTALKTTFEGVSGVRVVDLSNVETLPIVDPYRLSATLFAGAMTLAGVVPSDAVRAELVGDASDDLTLAAGMPDDAWVDATRMGIAGLAALKSGEFMISGRDLSLSGVAASPIEKDRATQAFDSLPDAYSATFDITVEDDGLPLRLALTVRDGTVSGTGKLPSDLLVADALTLIGDSTDITIVQALIPAFDPAWPDVARTALAVMPLLIDAQLLIEGQSVTLSGTATPDGKSQAEMLLAGLPSTYIVTRDIAIWDDGVPTEMSMTWDGTTATASGKFPAGFSPRGPAGVGVVNDARASFLPDTDGAFTHNANAGATALGLLISGTVIATAETITLTGSAATVQVDVVLNSVLAGVAAGTQITRNITYLDDGSPAAWTLIYDVTNGARIDGRLPDGVSAQDVADALGIAQVSGDPATAFADTDAGGIVDALTLAARYLPEVERLTYTRDDGISALDLVVSPGVDLDQIAADLAERLPVDVAFSLAPLDPLPADGTTRRNVLSGTDEELRNGFWLPSLDFIADVGGCTAQVNGVLAGAKITFLSSAARLDATSIRAINGLAAVAQPCLDAGLTLEIGGHTDATGSAVNNEVLSFDRANAVLDALAARGVPSDAMTAFGYGQNQPIADNDTAQGRAENRRTSLTWSNP